MGFFLFFKWYINLLGLVNDKAILVKEQQWYYFTYTWVEEVLTLPQGNNPNVNIIVRLEIELAYYNDVIHKLTSKPEGLSLRSSTFLLRRRLNWDVWQLRPRHWSWPNGVKGIAIRIDEKTLKTENLKEMSKRLPFFQSLGCGLLI